MEQILLVTSLGQEFPALFGVLSSEENETGAYVVPGESGLHDPTVFFKLVVFTDVCYT